METYYMEFMKKKKRITRKMKRYIHEKGIVTGSYVFGGYREGDSDIDILMPVKSKLTYDYLMENHYGVWLSGDYDDQEFKCAYVMDERGQLYNLLYFFNAPTLEKYLYATRAIVGMTLATDALHFIQNRKFRLRLFDFFKTAWEDFALPITNKQVLHIFDDEDDVPF